jgi:hypothetical protein
MSTPDERLAELLSDAVADVEPADRLDAIRDRTRVTTLASRRRGLFVVGGSVLATAAVVTAIALATGQNSPSADEPGPLHSPSNAVEPTPTETTPAPPPPQTTTAGGYYLGDTTGGPRLFREFTRVPADNPLDAGLAALQQAPDDPDYWTPWPSGAFSEAHFDGIGDEGLIQVVLADSSLHDRPAGMSQAEAEAAVQQVVYTMQAATQTRAAVQFVYDHNPIDQVLGVPTAEPLANASPLATLSHVSISDPAEGQEVSGTFHATGVANSFEANVRWEIRQGDTVPLEGFFTATGWMADRLFPFGGDVDVSSLGPGTYTFVVSEDDPSGGAEGNGPDTDTRTIVVQ